MKRVCAALLCLPLCLSLCSCRWHDAGDLSAVTAGAVSRTETGYALTAELALPDADRNVPDSKTVTGTAGSLAQAIDAAGAGRDAQLYWSHARILLLDASMLRGGLREPVRALNRSSEIRPSVRLCAASGTKADKLFECESIHGDPPGFALGDSLELAVRESRVPDMPLFRVLDRIESEGIDPVLPSVAEEKGQAVLRGAALLSGDRLCGRLNEEQAAALSLLLHAGETGVLYDGGARRQLTRLRTEIDAEMNNHTPVFTVTLRADAACESDGQARRTAEVLQQRCLDVIQVLQRTGCDALGFGRMWKQKDAAGYQANADAWRSAPVTMRAEIHCTPSAEGGSR